MYQSKTLDSNHKHLMIGSAYVSALLALTLSVCAVSLQAATSLSDGELADISGAGMNATPQNQTLPQQPQQSQQPNQNGAAATPSQTTPDIEGMELSPQILVILQSSADMNRHRTLRLQGQAQNGAKVLNLQNSLSSDTVSANNVFNGEGLDVDDVTTAIEVNQVNDLSQNHREQASLYTSETGYYSESSSHQIKQSDSFDQLAYISIDQQDQQNTITTIENNWLVSVDPINFSSPVSQGESLITFWESPTVFLIDPAGAGYIGSGLFGDSYGAEGYYSGLSVQGPTASVNHLEPYGFNNEDLLIDSTLRLGLIELGYFRITACAGGCLTFDTDLGEIEVLNVFDFLSLVDPVIAPNDGISFSSDGIILEGMGSVFDGDLNLNNGIAFVGTGHVQVLQPATFYSGGQITFNADASLSLTLDLSGIDQLNLFGGWPKQWTIPDQDVTLIDLTIPFTLINLQGNTIDRQFNGELIVPLGSGTVTADSNNQVSDDTQNSNVQPVVEVVMHDTSSHDFSESYEHSYLVGGQMTGAEAELLSLSEGSLSVNKNNSIQLSENAQQNVRIFNGVNAVSSVAANAVNISRPPVLSGAAVAMPQLSIQQHNLFVQRK